jgi:hypothetical protein
MIFELFRSFLSDAPEWAKKQGLLKESIAIQARHSRQKKTWAAHLQNCHQEIEAFLSAHPEKKKIGIFGSGYLFDFPKSILDDPSYELCLFDAVHPRSLKVKKTQAKLKFVTLDLNLAPEILNFDFQADLSTCELMISTNCLSQLALYGAKNVADNGDLREKRAQKLISQHLHFLREMKKPTLLLTDFEKIFKSPEQKVLVQESSLAKVKLKPPQREWLWQLAPLGEVSRTYSIDLKVGSWLIN